MMARADFLPHHHGACIRQSSEKGEHKAFQHTECSHGRYSGFRLSSDYHIDQHLANSVKKLIAENGETFAQIRRLNAEFRDKDVVTDVLSFPMFDYYNGAPREDLEPDPESGRVMLGDMVLCYTRACEQAEEYGHSAARECGFLTTHSVLHLLGYDHERGEDDTARMRRREKEYLEAIGLTRDDG